MSQTILITIVVLAVTSLATGQNVQPMVEQNLINTILKSGRSLGTGRSLECFTTYLPLLNAATVKYEEQYTVCLKNTANSKQLVDLEVEKDRLNVTDFGNQICSDYSACAEIRSSLDFFDCYTKVAGGSIQTSYDIQNISKASAQYILLRYEMINYDQNVCTDTCSAEYIDESSKLYSQLDECLALAEVRPDSSTRPPQGSSAYPPEESAEPEESSV